MPQVQGGLLMARFGPGGKIHSVLVRLDEGNATYEQLADDLGPAMKRKNVWHLLGKMLEAELIGGGRKRYYILEPGRRALHALGGGKEIAIEALPRPNVRVFS